ncbi:unnamed protein product [Allacma fusca]|uniref:LON peptidase N-terminal domain and RING finger protein 3 n=1 Tax=Allacma fusca TaxID=39272 RepID=A0A8J2MAA0_9HEXA|nr:unnamed protein product [Allacma fusca]
MSEYDFKKEKMVRLHAESFNFSVDPWQKATSPSSGGSSNNNINSNNCGSNGGVVPILPGPDSISVALKSNNFKVAIEILLHLYRVLSGSVRLDELRNFVECFCDRVVKKQSAYINQNGYLSNVDVLCCPICLGILVDPVTTMCGHSYCRKCLQKETVGKSCKRCRSAFTSVDISRAKLNVLLGAVIEKWWQKDLEAATYRSEGNMLFEAAKGEMSLSKYSQALTLRPTDHLSLGNRSHVLLTLGRSEEALADIDAAIKNCPLWAKGYFRKSSVLVSLGRYEEAFISLSLCLCLVKTGKSQDETTISSVKNEMVKVLHKIFLQAAGSLGSSTIRRLSFDHYAPYPSLKLQSGRHERDHFKMSRSGHGSEYNSSGDEITSPEREDRDDRDAPTGKILRKHNCNSEKKPSQYKMKKNSQLSGHQASHDTQIARIHRLFDRSLQEINRIYSDIDTKGKGSAEASKHVKIGRSVDSTLVSVNDLECTLCYRLLHQPVTTVCGHTYCRSCLERCLDHSPFCPLCKASLEDYLAHRRHAITQLLDIAISQFLPKEYAERVQQHLEEIDELTAIGRNSTAEIPIFVCTMAFPTVPCPLHVFEPRYRLMIRRCVESGGRRFGMCCYLQDGENNYADYGTLLEIRNVQYFADGRSVVDTVGKRRFKVLRKSQKDGYNTACIEILQDRPVVASCKPQIQKVHNQVYSEAKDWLESINQVLRQRIHTHFGPMPVPEENWMESTEGPAWTWWLLAILPLDTKAQLAILSMNSLEKRLESIQKVLRYVKTTQT